MANANILGALKRAGKTGSLSDVYVYGRVRCLIKRPNIIGKLPVKEGGMFAILDAFAVKCMGTDYFATRQYRSAGGIYYTRGSILIYIDNPKWVGKDVRVCGLKSTNRVKIRRQLNHTSNRDGISALAFAMSGSNYEVVPNYLIEIPDVYSDVKGTPFEDFVIKLISGDGVEYPETLDSIIEYRAVETYEELEIAEVEFSEFIEDSSKIDISDIDLDLTFHLEGMSGSVYLEPIKKEVVEMSGKRMRYAKSLIKEISDSYGDNTSVVFDASAAIRGNFIKNIAYLYHNNIGRSSIKGKQYVEDLLDYFLNVRLEDDSSAPASAKLKQGIEQLSKLVQIDANCLYESSIDDIDIPGLSSDVMFAIGVVGITTGIGYSRLVSNYMVCSRWWKMPIDIWFYTLVEYPYALGMLGGVLSVLELDKIYFSYSSVFSGKAFSRECGVVRSYLLLIDSIEGASSKDTMVGISSLKRSCSPYPKKGISLLESNNFPATTNQLEVLKAVCGAGIVMSTKVVSYLLNLKWFSDSLLNDLMEYGIVEGINNRFVILERDLEKELIIFETLIKKGQEDSGISLENVLSTVSEFEDTRGFSLEPLQKEGIKLCMKKAGVLSGCAGSGKTTTSDCMSMCLMNHLPSNYKMVYCTPTGKAARRLAEVVHGTVKTIHSQFKLGLHSDPVLASVYKRGKDVNSEVVYLLDEMAMCNTSLLYNVVRNLGDDDIIYFLGDIKQLVSIGKGNPFNLLMRMLPCVELGVSKRAAEGSEVNYNTTLINHMSDLKTKELFYDNSTFICHECSDVSIPLEVGKVWEGFMSGSLTGTSYREEEIQVITGYAAPKVQFSTTKINPIIQSLLRKNDKLLFKNNDRLFYKKDRVIHVSVNCYNYQRYIEVEPGVYQSVVTLGVVNGETGILDGVICSTAVTFLEFDKDALSPGIYGNLSEDELKSLLETRESRETEIRDDGMYKKENRYLVRVKVYDVDLGRDVYIFYHATERLSGDIKSLVGSDLANLDLAYALTTHKMQGSQSRVCICIYGESSNPDFINRNMINTMVTRSQEVVCMLGSVKGEDSTVTRGRRTKSEMETKDILSMLVNEQI